MNRYGLLTRRVCVCSSASPCTASASHGERRPRRCARQGDGLAARAHAADGARRRRRTPPTAHAAEGTTPSARTAAAPLSAALEPTRQVGSGGARPALGAASLGDFAAGHHSSGGARVSSDLSVLRHQAEESLPCVLVTSRLSVVHIRLGGQC